MKVGMSGALVPLLLLVVVFLILVGGQDGSGREPQTERGGSMPSVVINGIGFPYAEGTFVTFTQGFWVSPADAVIWWGNQVPPYTRGAHPAVDFSAGYGTSILAILDGEVVYVGANSGFGNHMIIRSKLEDGSDVYVLYGHFSNIMTQVGDQKKIGDVIGQEGNTGLSLGSHLHIEMSTLYVPGDMFWGNIDYQKVRSGIV